MTDVPLSRAKSALLPVSLADLALALRPRLAAVVLAAALSGCAAPGPTYQAPEPTTPAAWRGAPEAAASDPAVLAQWWRLFHDPVLDALVADALAANSDLASASAKLREARARRGLASANLAPTVTASGSASRLEAGNGLDRNSFAAGIDASWEIDVFGGGKRELEAAAADYQASAENVYGARVSLVAEVARNYIVLRTTERRLALTEANLTAQQELYRITGWRHQAGLVSGLDEIQALTELERTSASMSGLYTTIDATRNQLSLLLGRAPGELPDRLATPAKIPVADVVGAGIPADTLRQRPDVRAAERRLAAQTARLGVAEAARYPSFRLGGSLGLNAASLASMVSKDATSLSLLAGITAPIFDAGRIRGTIEVQDALLEQARLSYQAAVLAALQEVENALVNLSNTRATNAALTRAAASARSAFELARQSYAAGLADFQTVLGSQRTVLGLEDQLAASAGEVSAAQIQLYKALGGGWSAVPEPLTAKDGR